jgi:hypothetical protein
MTVFANPTFEANYQGLCNKIADTLNRQDLVSVIPDFTVLATSRIQRDLARLRHPLAVSRAIATVQNNYVPLPIDYLAVYQLMDQDTSILLSYLSPDQSMQVMSQGFNPAATSFLTAPNYLPNGTNIFYTIIGNTIRIIPPPNVNSPTLLDLWYFAKLPALGTGNPTNWALTHYSDLYLYGSLAHSAPYLKNDERIGVWDGIYQKILSDIEVEADRAIRPQSKLVSARKSF